MAAYDAIVVGAGSTGAALAARFYEKLSTRILPLKAGPNFPSAETPDEMRIPEFRGSASLADRNKGDVLANAFWQTIPRPAPALLSTEIIAHRSEGDGRI
jgi:choline dehydrogenase-like flavoprotein